MNTTTNYSLKKPELTDPASISDINDNMDSLDTTVKAVSNVANAAAPTASIVNDLTTGGATVPASAETVKTLKGLTDTLNTEMEERTTYGVYTGLVVAQQTVADMTVKCSAGTIYMANGTRFTPSAVAVIAVTAADATNPRIDIVYVKSDGAITYLAGTAAASPSAPATPAGGMLLATISVAVGQTTVVTANITLRRKMMWTEDLIAPTLINSWVRVGTEYTRYTKNIDGFVEMEVAISGGANGSIAFNAVAGFRPAVSLTINGSGGTSVAIANITSGGNFIPANGAGNMRFRFRYKAEA